jgi:hypothetical protein
MLSIYDLYDLYAIFLNIRAYPDYELNHEILLNIINVLENRHVNHDENQFRTALRLINTLDMEKYPFVQVINLYVHFSAFLKDEGVYKTLVECCKCLLNAVKEKNVEKTEDLADCLHNLPIHIIENGFAIPKKFWKGEVKYYRCKWDKDFLK